MIFTQIVLTERNSLVINTIRCLYHDSFSTLLHAEPAVRSRTAPRWLG